MLFTVRFRCATMTSAEFFAALVPTFSPGEPIVTATDSRMTPTMSLTISPMTKISFRRLSFQMMLRAELMLLKETTTSYLTRHWRMVVIHFYSLVTSYCRCCMSMVTTA